MPELELRIESTPSPRPVLTLIHVLWLASACGATTIAFTVLRSATLPVRITLTVLAFALAVVITHVICVFIVTAVVMPRLGPNSHWRREVDS